MGFSFGTNFLDTRYKMFQNWFQSLPMGQGFDTVPWLLSERRRSGSRQRAVVICTKRDVVRNRYGHETNLLLPIEMLSVVCFSASMLKLKGE